MTPEDQHTFRDEGLDPERRTTLRAAAAATRAWERAHPWTLDEYFDFLTDLHALFGPFPSAREPTRGDDFRL